MDGTEAWLWIATHPKVSRLTLVKIRDTGHCVLNLSVAGDRRPLPSQHPFEGSFVDVVAQATAVLEEVDA